MPSTAPPAPLHQKRPATAEDDEDLDAAGDIDDSHVDDPHLADGLGSEEEMDDIDLELDPDHPNDTHHDHTSHDGEDATPKKKRGRPAGSKNKSTNTQSSNVAGGAQPTGTPIPILPATSASSAGASVPPGTTVPGTTSTVTGAAGSATTTASTPGTGTGTATDPPVKRGRGRPRKIRTPEELAAIAAKAAMPPRKRGRPPKKPKIEDGQANATNTIANSSTSNSNATSNAISASTSAPALATTNRGTEVGGVKVDLPTQPPSLSKGGNGDGDGDEDSMDTSESVEGVPPKVATSVLKSVPPGTNNGSA